jgi:arsenite-transporting ATPase
LGIPFDKFFSICGNYDSVIYGRALRRPRRFTPSARAAFLCAGLKNAPAPERTDAGQLIHGDIMAAKSSHVATSCLVKTVRSPCTEEVAVFHAFSRIVAEARSAFVVLDTAPTGHTLLLMDATGAYHRQMVRQTNSAAPTGRIITPLMRLQDPVYTRVLLVTLAETTPVSQAGALQEDLRRAHIEPYAWVINKSLLAAGTCDPLLRQRLLGERKQIDRVCASMAKRVFFVQWQATPPVGLPALQELAHLRPLAPSIP